MAQQILDDPMGRRLALVALSTLVVASGCLTSPTPAAERESPPSPAAALAPFDANATAPGTRDNVSEANVTRDPAVTRTDSWETAITTPLNGDCFTHVAKFGRGNVSRVAFGLRWQATNPGTEQLRAGIWVSLGNDSYRVEEAVTGASPLTLHFRRSWDQGTPVELAICTLPGFLNPAVGLNVHAEASGSVVVEHRAYRPLAVTHVNGTSEVSGGFVGLCVGWRSAYGNVSVPNGSRTARTEWTYTPTSVGPPNVLHVHMEDADSRTYRPLGDGEGPSPLTLDAANLTGVRHVSFTATACEGASLSQPWKGVFSFFAGAVPKDYTALSSV